MTLTELKATYQGLPAPSKKELRWAFMQAHNLTQSESFNAIIRGVRIPTPKQLAWLQKNILEYQAHYEQIDAEGSIS